jgi:hypothetical protein
MKDYLVDNKLFYNIQYNFITYFNLIVRILLILYMFGAVNSNVKILITINFYVKVFIALFLMYRFNGFRKNKILFTELDQKIAFSAGLYILVISFYDYVNTMTNRSRNIISRHLNTITNYVISVKHYAFNLLKIPDPLKKTIT